MTFSDIEMAYSRVCIFVLLTIFSACDGMMRRPPITATDFWNRYLTGIDQKAFSLRLDARNAVGGGAAIAALSTSSEQLIESLKTAGYPLEQASDLEVKLVLSRADNVAGSAGKPDWFNVPAGAESFWVTAQRGGAQVTVLAVPESKTALFVVVGDKL